jgi:hypothetical protein
MLAGCSDEVPVGEYTVCVSKDGDTITIEIKSSPGSQPVTGGTIYQYDAQGNAVGETEFSGDSTSVDIEPGATDGQIWFQNGVHEYTCGQDIPPC